MNTAIDISLPHSTLGSERLLFAFPGLTLLVMLALSLFAPTYYSRISQEDQLVEWLTALLFFAAGVLLVRYVIQNRKLFASLVAAFCFVCAFEEVSWGQRLLGFNPPQPFLSANLQQEVTLHNFFNASTHDLVFAVAVFGFLVVIPILSRIKRIPIHSWGSSPVQLVPLALVSLLLYFLDPIHMSTEWVELTIACLFFSSSSILSDIPACRAILVAPVLLLIGIGFANQSLNAVDNQRVDCARQEVRSLLNDLQRRAATEKLFNLEGAVHLRLFKADSTGYLNISHLQEFSATTCGSEQPNRKNYVVDPWGMSYWFFIDEDNEGERKLSVYSFGPNRKRDNNENSPATMTSGSDDIALSTSITRSTNLNY